MVTVSHVRCRACTRGHRRRSVPTSCDVLHHKRLQGYTKRRDASRRGYECDNDDNGTTITLGSLSFFSSKSSDPVTNLLKAVRHVPLSEQHAIRAQHRYRQRSDRLRSSAAPLLARLDHRLLQPANEAASHHTHTHTHTHTHRSSNVSPKRIKQTEAAAVAAAAAAAGGAATAVGAADYAATKRRASV